MFARLKELIRRPPAQPGVEGRLVYAIGDIHGRDDLFLELLKAIYDDLRRHAHIPGRPVLVLLGDYIDRGPSSYAVIERILRLREDRTFEVRALMGNHEQSMLKFLDDASIGPRWAMHGGSATLAAYGVEAPHIDAEQVHWDEARAALARALPLPHRRFLLELERMVTIGDYAFVHAGVRPGRRLHEQEDNDLFWIRRDFLRHEKRHEKVIVHGHTPADEPERHPHRIGVDTGAYRSGVLTAVRLTDEDCDFLQASLA